MKSAKHVKHEKLNCILLDDNLVRNVDKCNESSFDAVWLWLAITFAQAILNYLSVSNFYLVIEKNHILKSVVE
jgi:hypothetical protein